MEVCVKSRYFCDECNKEIFSNVIHKNLLIVNRGRVRLHFCSKECSKSFPYEEVQQGA